MVGGDQLDLVEIACFHCEKAFAVCIRDYRGQRYCSPRCRELGYRRRKREAGRRYQGTPNGRERHRQRQQGLRDRRVTHGATVQAPAPGVTVSLAAEETHEETPDGRSRGRSPGAATTGASDCQGGRGLRLRRCIVCGRRGAAEAEFIRAVLDYYLWMPGTATVVSRHDRACARGLFRRGVPLQLVKDAMAVAVARRTFRQGDPLPRVRALHFFLPVIDELLEVPCEPGYARYLEHKLRPLAAVKVAEREAAPRRPQKVSDRGTIVGEGRRDCP
jgi:hypothetical protein